jgi:hypothetical protein
VGSKPLLSEANPGVTAETLGVAVGCDQGSKLGCEVG